MRLKSRGGTLLGIFIGLVIGISIAFGVVWYLNKSPLPFQNKYEGAPKTEKNGAPGTAPAPLPGKPGDKPVERRFDFYNILEGKPAPQGGMAPPAPAPQAPAMSGMSAPQAPAMSGMSAPQAPAVEAKPQASDVFYLQVGAFQKAADADNLKAKLALTGLYASVQEVNIPDKGTMHRVRVGPFRDPEEMNRARALLAQNGVQASVVKNRE
jgi:cell division protein FtsN